MNYGRLISVFFILMSFALLLGLLLGSLFQVPYGNIAIVKIHGEITSSGSSLFTSSVNAESITEQLSDIKINPLIQAVIIDINSGGGSSVASSEIVTAIKDLGKPTIALIRDIGASGGYWAASACDYIVAHELSLVGSIGVNMNYLEFSGLLEEYNVSYVNLSYPEHKDILSQYRPLTDLEQGWVQEWLESAYDYLVDDLALNLNITREELMPYANGSLFIGYQALDYGLVNELGGWREAYNKSIELGSITEPIIIDYERSYSLFDLISGLTNEKSTGLRT